METGRCMRCMLIRWLELSRGNLYVYELLSLISVICMSGYYWGNVICNTAATLLYSSHIDSILDGGKPGAVTRFPPLQEIHLLNVNKMIQNFPIAFHHVVCVLENASHTSRDPPETLFLFPTVVICYKGSSMLHYPLSTLSIGLVSTDRPICKKLHLFFSGAKKVINHFLNVMYAPYGVTWMINSARFWRHYKHTCMDKSKKMYLFNKVNIIIIHQPGS